jgi:histone H3/H4
LKAHQELFRRTPDETFESLQTLWEHCDQQKARSTDRWFAPRELSARVSDDALMVTLGSDGAFLMNDWSFTQLCHLAGVNKDTVNRLSPKTAGLVLSETLPKGNKPFQFFTEERRVRSLHGSVYTRLWNADLVMMLREFAVDFQPPQKAITGGTGLYAGQQDAFAFLIDPLAWVELQGESYAPGFFVWNSEVGRRSLGIQTFWFQACCQNHILWDAIDVCEFSSKHTSKVQDGLATIRSMIEALVKKRDERKDAFASVVRKAMETKLGADADEAFKTVCAQGIPRSVAQEALEIAREKGRLTIWSIVDALTRLAQKHENAGDRTEADQRASRFLSLVS